MKANDHEYENSPARLEAMVPPKMLGVGVSMKAYMPPAAAATAATGRAKPIDRTR